MLHYCSYPTQLVIVIISYAFYKTKHIIVCSFIVGIILLLVYLCVTTVLSYNAECYSLRHRSCLEEQNMREITLRSELQGE